MALMPHLYLEKCNGCGLCVAVCTCHALQMVDNMVIIVATETECNWCTLCEAICPTDAIACPFEIVIE